MADPPRMVGCAAMRRWLWAVMAGSVSALGIAGCSGGAVVSAGEARCRALCERARSCPSDTKATVRDCYIACDDLEALNRANDCHDEVDALYDCIERHEPCADVDVECADQQDVYSDCIADQCSTDPDRDICL